jgi:hypothetical protein
LYRARLIELFPHVEHGCPLRNLASQLVDAVYSGRLNPKIGVGLAPLLNLQLRAIESSDLEERIAKLEQANVEPDVDTEASFRSSTAK